MVQKSVGARRVETMAVARWSFIIIGSMLSLLFSYLVWGCTFEVIFPRNITCATPLVSSMIVLAAFGSPLMTGFLWLGRRWTVELRERNASFRQASKALTIVVGAGILASFGNFLLLQL
jgi:hypothetical protein